ncbi:MAG: type I-E CRISPR-associated protein Cas5/CasD [Oscillospiraceae bacterium]|nr:type I-E CRISPR-associated protein Cas5/CasD [Oscillospiraceae bacterium]
MSTLLLRLAAPLQSWGDCSKFEVRGTGREPTKSGVIGMLAAALGISREDADALEPLKSLRFGIRADREGHLLRDFHIARNQKTSYVTYRDYLSDAAFLAGLELDNDAFLEQLAHALTHPVYPLYLGRRSCPVTLPLVLGIRKCDLISALKTEPCCTNEKTPDSLRIQYDDADGTPSARRQDVPESFSVRHRSHGWRIVTEEILSASEHDPMAEL